MSEQEAALVEAPLIPLQDSGLIHLADVENNTCIQDMDYYFYYDRVKKPDGNNSNYFSLQYREAQQEQWIICKSLLSTMFTVVKTQEVIRQIQTSLTGNIENEHHFRSGPSVKSSFLLSGYHIDIAAEPEVDRILFQLLTNIDTDIELLTTSNLTFNIINGFSGNHALQLNYGLLKTIVSGQNEDTKIIPINNIFVLDRFTKRLIHDNHLSINIEDVTNVQLAIQTQINDYRRAPFSQDMIDELERGLPKKFYKKFISMFENVPENLRNFYYATYILSVMLDAERSIALEIKLRTLVTKKLHDILKVIDRQM